jgi:hypothetical protein
MHHLGVTFAEGLNATELRCLDEMQVIMNSLSCIPFLRQSSNDRSIDRLRSHCLKLLEEGQAALVDSCPVAVRALAQSEYHLLSQIPASGLAWEGILKLRKRQMKMRGECTSLGANVSWRPYTHVI